LAKYIADVLYHITKEKTPPVPASSVLYLFFY